MQLEQVRMFLVNGFQEPLEVNVIKKNGKVFVYSYQNETEYTGPIEYDRFFDSKEEADKYYSDIMSGINIEKTKEYIQFFLEYNIGKLESILPKVIYDALDKRSDRTFSFWDMQFLREALNGILNINGISFRASDISQIKYGDKWLSVILKNGEEITPRKEVEVFVIKSLFGENHSDMSFTNINKPED